MPTPSAGIVKFDKSREIVSINLIFKNIHFENSGIILF